MAQHTLCTHFVWIMINVKCISFQFPDTYIESFLRVAIAIRFVLATGTGTANWTQLWTQNWSGRRIDSEKYIWYMLVRCVFIWPWPWGLLFGRQLFLCVCVKCARKCQRRTAKTAKCVLKCNARVAVVSDATDLDKIPLWTAARHAHTLGLQLNIYTHATARTQTEAAASALARKLGAYVNISAAAASAAVAAWVLKTRRHRRQQRSRWKRHGWHVSSSAPLGGSGIVGCWKIWRSSGACNVRLVQDMCRHTILTRLSIPNCMIRSSCYTYYMLFALEFKIDKSYTEVRTIRTIPYYLYTICMHICMCSKVHRRDSI